MKSEAQKILNRTVGKSGFPEGKTETLGGREVRRNFGSLYWMWWDRDPRPTRVCRLPRYRREYKIQSGPVE